MSREATGTQQMPFPFAHHIPGYELLGILGRGGMGIVYKTRQVALNRAVALKMILAEAHANKIELRRFRTEAEAGAQFQHSIHHPSRARDWQHLLKVLPKS